MFKIRNFNNRALSPIFATLIVLGVVTTLFVPVFMWASNFSSQNRDDWKAQGETATERITIEEVNLKTNQSACTVYVRNIGKTTVTINDLLISKADGSGSIRTYTAGQFSSNPTSVTGGELLTITILNLGFNTESNAYSIQVFTTRGVGERFLKVVA